MPLRAIVETITSAPDSNGNRYHISKFYNVATGPRDPLIIETDGETNGRFHALHILKDWEAILAINYTVSKSEWKLLRKHAIYATPESLATLATFLGK